MTALAFPAAAFASADGRARYQVAYQAVLDRWPLPVRSRLLETEIGTTHLLEAGPESAPPLLLLHGAGVSATMWARNVAALASRHRLYALDTLGGLGPSVAHNRVRSPADLHRWLGEVIDALDLGAVNLVGMSMGGWIATGFAAAAPERVRKLALIAPGATFAPLRLGFVLRGLPLMLWPRPAYGRRYLHWASTGSRRDDPDYMAVVDGLGAVMAMGFAHARPRMRVFPTVLDDATLAAVTCPVLLLLGAQEKQYDPTAVVRRARAILQQVDARVFDDASHDLNLAQPAQVDAALLGFFANS